MGCGCTRWRGAGTDRPMIQAKTRFQDLPEKGLVADRLTKSRSRPDASHSPTILLLSPPLDRPSA